MRPLRLSRSAIHLKVKELLLLGVILSVGLAACKPETTQETKTQTATADSTDVVELTATPTPLKELTVCMAQEPASLYLYDGRNNRSKWNILEALYDGPIDVIAGKATPVMIERTPNLENGDLSLQAVVVSPGQEVIDARGQLVVFKEGILARPAGCQQSACAITWDGKGEFSMDVMNLKFTLKEGLTWSDGEALTAADSVFSYQVAKDEATPGSRWAILRTGLYQAVDEHTIAWQGIPGFITSEVSQFLWIPLPRHVLGNLSSAELLADVSANDSPLGWGAYRLESWTRGEQITFSANENYFRANEGIPFFDRLNYKFIASADEALSAMEQGQCDILDESYVLENRFGALMSGQSGAWNLHILNGPEWDGLVFGIKPTAYDDGYTPQYGDRVDFFGDKRTRQAFGYCIDRQRIAEEVYLDAVADLPDIQGQYSLPYDVNEGARLLDEAGWKDVDADPVTPRQAWGVTGVTNGTAFSVQLLTTNSHMHTQTAQVIQESLATCGVEVSLQELTPEELFAPGPGGVLFGRQFDLALFAWGTSGGNDCGLYQGWQVPTQNNAWIGTNLGGYQNQAYDEACSDVLLSLDDGSSDNLGDILNDQVPVIPVNTRFRLVMTSRELTINVQLFSERSWLSAIEQVK
jgi:peptide/nickel transport system substrate-binding protein